MPPMKHSAFRRLSLLCLATIGLHFALLRDAGAADLVISEFMAANTGGLRDEDGETSDWIEILNVGSSTINTLGWRLTDDSANMGKWVLPATNIPPSGFLLVWASAKDRKLSGAPLHANFSLSAGGEYLGLIRPDLSIATEFNPFPNQYDNISYGIVQQTDIRWFVQTNATGRVYVPSNNTLGLTWTANSFNAASWLAATNGIGYEQSVPGLAVKNFKANVLVGSLAAADTVIATPSQQSAVYSENRSFIDYFNSGGTGNYPNNITFPGLSLAVEVEDFVIEATATVTIPAAGQWTFGVNSDDGFRLNVGSFSTSWPDPRGPADTLATFNFASAGDYSLRLVFYERGGGSGVELFAAQGSFATWNGVNFKLVGDTANGGLAVRSVPIGQTEGFRPFIRTDLLSRMVGKSPGAYIRLPFNVGAPAALETLTLQARYDDGFAAYLNGTLVALRNAPAVPAFDSLALAERPDNVATVQESIDLTPYLGNLVAGSNTLALHGMNLATSDDDFLL
ncbi:MAG: hypothetical protein FJ405_11890, partial [Verrucomicrobia bacterium]|nr:hypothetical protein [Verrucomicrobiota bacterium]